MSQSRDEFDDEEFEDELPNTPEQEARYAEMDKVWVGLILTLIAMAAVVGFIGWLSNR